MQTNLEETTRKAEQLSLTQPVFNWTSKDKYMELRHYDICDAEEVPIIKKLVRQGRSPTYTNTEVEQESHHTNVGMLKVLDAIFRPLHNDTTLSSH